MEKDYKTEMRMITEGLYEWCLRHERRQRATRTIIGIAAVVAIAVITLLPNPDGHYISNPQCRVEALHSIDQTLFAKL